MSRVCYSALLALMALALSMIGCGSSASVQGCEGSTCGEHGTCDESTGEVVCSCDDGYVGDQCDACAAGYHDDGGVCQLDDPCAGTTVCTDLQRECLVDQGTVVCGPCLDGFTDYGDGECRPDDPCAGVAVCEDLHRGCVNDEGTAVCGPCLAGFMDYGDGECRTNDPCATDTVCDTAHRECLNDQGTAVCGSCLTAYTDYGDGECRPSDPCATDTVCDTAHRECLNDQGVAVCGDCISGYVDNGGVCVEGCTPTSNTGVEVPFDLLILMDKSSSMNDAGKWAATVSGMNAFATSSSASGLAVGLQFFPLAPSGTIPGACTSDPDCGIYGPCLPGFNMCSGSFATDTSCDPADYSNPDVPITPMPAAVVAVQTSLANHSPDGSATPLEPALAGVMPYASSWAQSHPTHSTHVVLITDGEPTGCMTNSIADSAAVVQAAANGNPVILTFVIGVGSTLGALDPIALAGGTGQMYLVDTSGNVTQQTLDALDDIAAHRNCRYQIPAAVMSSGDYNLVGIALTDTANPPNVTAVAPVGDASSCDPATGGWHYDDVAAPTEILLCSASCDVLIQGNLAVDILVGCDPLAP